MKTTERHELKHNEVADTLQGAYLQLERNRTTILTVAGAVLAVAAIWGGYSYFTAQKEAKAGALLAQALVVAEAQVVPPIAPAPGQTAPPPAAGTYPSEAAKLDATVPKYLAAADAYPSTQAGISARYQAAAALMAQGKPDEARTQYEAVIAADGRGLYGRMARLGVAELDVKAGKFDPAIATLAGALARRARRPAGRRDPGPAGADLRRRRQEDGSAAGAGARDDRVCDVALRRRRQEAARDDQARGLTFPMTTLTIEDWIAEDTSGPQPATSGPMSAEGRLRA